MAFSPLPRDYDEAIKEINVWRAKYTREARDEIEAQRRQVAELEGYNVGLADEVRIVRNALDDLVDAIDGSSDMDEMDGPEYKVAQDCLEEAVAKARPHTEAAITQQAIEELDAVRKK